MHKLLPALALLSGVSGIAYEVLYVRLLSAYIGNIFYVSAVLLATFLLGIALGSFLANSYIRHLRYIELAIGTYALLFAGLFASLGLSITHWVAVLPLPDVIALPAFVFLILILPAAAIGFSVPLFAQYIEHYKRHDRKTFSFTYALYNVGAAFSVIAIEYLFISKFGISKSIMLVASINMIIGGLLFAIKSPPKITSSFSENLLRALTPQEKKSLIALAIISTVSGVVQLNFFSLFHYVIGPLNESFALLIGASLISITLASVLVRYTRINFSYSILVAGLLCIVPIVFLNSSIGQYASFYQQHSEAHMGIILTRAFIIAAVAMPAFVCFGLTIPAVVRDHGVNSAGLALSVASAGNAVGYLLYTFAIFNYARHLPVFIAVSLVLCALHIWHAQGSIRSKTIRAAGIFTLCIGVSVAAYLRWPPKFYIVAYHDYQTAGAIERRAIPTDIKSMRRFGSDSVVITLPNGDRELYFNGYRSLTFSKHNSVAMHESLVGAVAAFFSKEHGRALVFGLGTGITAASTAHSYGQVRVAEINPTMIEAAGLFPEENDNILGKDNVTIDIQDGLITLLASTLKYDAIINTVPSPRYFSANKLWTKDVFDEAQKHLNDGGVFIGWIDSRLGLRGVRILQNTLRASFADCRFVYLSNGYQAFVCSPQPLVFRPIRDDRVSPVFVEQIRAKGWQDSASVFVRELIFQSGDDDGPDVGINSLDHPLLEFEHTYDGGHLGRLSAFTQRLTYDAFTQEPKQRICEVIAIIDQHHLLRGKCQQ